MHIGESEPFLRLLPFLPRFVLAKPFVFYRARVICKGCDGVSIIPTCPITSPLLRRPSISFNREVVKGQLAEFLCKSIVDLFIDIIYRSIGVSMSASGQCFMNASRTVQVKSLPSCDTCRLHD
jgi:hypothetical protein